MIDFALQRLNMVNNQLRPNRILDPRLTAAFEAVPRELFVPEAMRQVAYVDEDIALGGGRYLMDPTVIGRMIQAAGIEPDDRALVVGAGSGYTPAIASRMARHVVALESDEGLVHRARANLEQLGAANVAVVLGPLADGHAEGGPYDAILVDGAVADVPPALVEQLAEGGRLVAVVRNGAAGKARLCRREGGRIADIELFDSTVPLLAEFVPKPQFVF